MDDRRPACRDRVLPTRGWCKLLALTLVCALALPAAAAKLSVAKKKEIARSAYDDAEHLREALNGRPAADRSRRDYQKVIDAYRKVYYTAPNSIRAEPAIVALAEVLADEGRTFKDERLLHAAIGQYEFLRKEYPGSNRRVAALFAIAQIYAEDLNDAAKGKQAFQDFLKHYPRSGFTDDARKAIADLDAGKKVSSRKLAAKSEESEVETRHAASPAAPKKVADVDAVPVEKNDKKASARSNDPREQPSRADLPAAVRAAAEKADAAVDGKAPKPDTRKPVETLLATSPAREKTDTAKSDQPAVESVRKGKMPLVTGIRHWSTPDYTRIAVDLEQDVPYEVGRISDPDRLFFDLHGTKLAPGLMGKEYEVEDGLLKKVRVAQFQPGETRIVLDLGDVADYQAFLLPNPYRLIVDVHGKKKPAATKALSGSAKTSAPAPVTIADKKQPDTAKIVADDKSTMPAASRTEPVTKTSAAKSDSASKREPTSSAASSRTIADPKPDLKQKPDAATATAAIRRTADDAATASKTDSKPDDADGDDSVVVPHPEGRLGGAKGGVSAASRNVVAREAKPTASGDRSLIRALGLKIGRIVVDAGHGGHDTGTIGPTGLLEKDLVLDVALRLGKLLESRVGADVVYTRDDDTFIPLETRTAIANREQADLFISVHANSSRDPKARGVETYYLNFTTSADALDVAARENAVSDTSIHELQDLVKKIALKEKVEESREFAADVQQSLKIGLSGRGSTMRDRGVRKAPFIVLIGANMPSILAEISFVSNPADEKKLKTPEYRQKIAESLYRGIARYVSGLSGIKVAANATKTGQ